MGHPVPPHWALQPASVCIAHATPREILPWRLQIGVSITPCVQQRAGEGPILTASVDRHQTRGLGRALPIRKMIRSAPRRPGSLQCLSGHHLPSALPILPPPLPCSLCPPHSLHIPHPLPTLCPSHPPSPPGTAAALHCSRRQLGSALPGAAGPRSGLSC